MPGGSIGAPQDLSNVGQTGGGPGIGDYWRYLTSGWGNGGNITPKPDTNMGQGGPLDPQGPPPTIGPPGDPTTPAGPQAIRTAPSMGARSGAGAPPARPGGPLSAGMVPVPNVNTPRQGPGTVPQLPNLATNHPKQGSYGIKRG